MSRILSVLGAFFLEIMPFIHPGKEKPWLTPLIIFLVNLFPLIGVLFFGWTGWFILIIFWAETGIIGIFNILRMMVSNTVTEKTSFSPGGFIGGFFISLFFLFHYFLFMIVHGIFLFFMIILFFKPVAIQGTISTSDQLAAVIEKLMNLELFQFHNFSLLDWLDSEWMGIILIFISHLFTFFWYFVKNQEYKTKVAFDYFMKPYSRIFIMHLTIIFGMFVMMLLHFPAIASVIILIWIKIITDLRSFDKNRKSPV